MKAGCGSVGLGARLAMKIKAGWGTGNQAM